MSIKQKIVGRYAPSPTGRLHLGNLRTALLAWLQVRLEGGQFLLRMEDVDTPRVVKGSDLQILKDLEWLGLDWDGEVVYQSQRTHLYKEVLKSLAERSLIYPCFCSRKDIQLASSAPHGSAGVYTGVCRDLSNDEIIFKEKKKIPAMRLKVSSDLRESCGDFVVKRSDGLFAYQLAVVVDDIKQGVTHVLRGEDLSDSTDRQLYLAGLIAPDAEPINYTHVPLMLDKSGVRLSKRDGSVSIDAYTSVGYSAQKIIGEFAFDVGLIDKFEFLSARELLVHVSSSLQA